jgi:hypothetical protein
VDECKSLLGLWRSIAKKVEQDNWRIRLTQDERNEIVDAVACGEYDLMLAAMKDPPS